MLRSGLATIAESYLALSSAQRSVIAMIAEVLASCGGQIHGAPVHVMYGVDSLR